MKIKRKLKMGIENLNDRIVLKVPKVDNFHDFLMGFMGDLGFDDDKRFEFDMLFSDIWDQYLFSKQKNHEIELFIDEDYVIIVLRFPKNEKEKIMKIIHNNFFFSDKNTKDAVIKIESDDTQNQKAMKNEK